MKTSCAASDPLSISAPLPCVPCWLSGAPSIHLPLKLCPNRLHLPEADPAAVSAPDHGHPGGPALCGCGHQPGGEVRGQAACRYWGGGVTPPIYLRENIPAGLAHLMALQKQLMEKVIVPGTVLGSGYGVGTARAWVPVWPGSALRLGVAWPGRGARMVRTGQAPRQVVVVVSTQLVTSNAAPLPSGYTSAGSATSSSRASVAS